MRNIRFRKYLLLLLVFVLSCRSQSDQHTDEEITFQPNFPEQKVDVFIDGKLFTSYRWPENVFKPVLYPIISAGGSIVTRGFPLEPRPGERDDHRHQVGNWLNFGNVNGSDFWGNGHTGERSPNGGEIKHVGIEKLSKGKGAATLVSNASWVDSTGHELLKERTTLHFISRGPVRIIDRITTLTNTSDHPVKFNDTKEGMFGLRVARQLELPEKGKAESVNASMDPESPKVTGNYRSSEGISGEKVWGTRARWMNLHGQIGDENISVVMCDHPKNISYPTWWHARGYGLFSANPLGAKDFTDGKQEVNLSVAPGDATTFRYRIIIASGDDPSDEALNHLADEFAQLY